MIEASPIVNKNTKKNIILSTLNAKYIHSSLGLRYLYANMGSLQKESLIHEYSINARIEDIAESLLNYQPKIIGLGVYIWNINQTLALIRLLRQLIDDTVIVLGGPEVSYETDSQEIIAYADYVLCGQADLAFAQLCQQIYSKKTILFQSNSVLNKIYSVTIDDLDELKSPYPFYTQEDIQNRVIYIEASRGCPFKCEFCLSALDKTSIAFDLDKFLAELNDLFCRGARNFKFVDRTFNLKIKNSQKILTFFLDKLKSDKNLAGQLRVHFEIIPDRLPEQLKDLIQQFPAHCLQFEVGIQTFNSQVQELISRRQDNQQSINNLRWLKNHSTANLHTDLIAGLPGENWQSFADGFNQLVALKPHEIQLGILKRLKGTPVIRHTDNYQLNFNQNPPYEILSTSQLSYHQLRELSRFARYWDIISNSGKFPHTVELLLGEQPFQHFYLFSRWLYQYSKNTHRFSLRKLFDLLYLGGQELNIDKKLLWNSLWLDYQQAKLKGKPEFMKLTD